MEKAILGFLLLGSVVSADVYLGCFLDKPDRLLEGKFTSGNDMTVQKCSDSCRNAGYIYFGVQYSSQCFCGNKVDKSGYGKKSESECSAKCSGDKSQMCGGTWRMNIYRINAEYLGCYLDKSTRLLAAKFTHDTDMTKEKCFELCSDYQYAGLQYSSQCFCGNNIEKDGYETKPESDCSAKCTGDNRQTCGGTWRMNVYRLKLDTGVHLGCYLDKSVRLLDGQSTSSNDMTVNKCYNFCKKLGYFYFGVQYASQCFCGNKVDKSGYEKKPESECSAKCSGDKSQTCGGTWRMNVYQINVDYKGCYLDKSARLLEAKFTNGNDMTLKKCFNTCYMGKYQYAGVQYSSQCFCGNDIEKSGYGEKEESECSAKCSGDQSQNCGGTWRMNVYKLKFDQPSGVPLGCFLDKPARLLDGKSTSGGDMTVQKCTGFCRRGGYNFCGVQYASQCFCGNQADKSGYGKKPKSDCSAKCTGDNSQTCGGTWRMNVYQINVEYMGCYLDKSTRLLEAKFTHGADMTLEKCFKTCSNGKYQFAGLQYSTQCFCGNDISKPGYGIRPESECAAACRGDKDQTCGGTWRMSVYKI